MGLEWVCRGLVKCPGACSGDLYSRVEAVYPATLKGRREEMFGVFVVTAKGEVTRARGAFRQIPECEQAALAAISLWKFKPGLIMGHAVNTRLFVRFLFKEAKP